VDEAGVQGDGVADDQVMGEIIPNHSCKGEAHPRAIDKDCQGYFSDIFADN
jgi:hypothetical protein